MSVREVVFILHDHDVISRFSLAEFERCVRQQGEIFASAAEMKPLPETLQALFVTPDQAQLTAAYIKVGEHNYAEAMVLFLLPLEQGCVAANWYMPLQRLASGAGRGPNMGAGRIHLACRSQCSISWHADSLWEPVTSDFMALRKALREQVRFTLADISSTAMPSSTLISSPASTPASELAPQPLAAHSSAVAQVQQSAKPNLGLISRVTPHQDPEVEQLKRSLRHEVENYRQQLQQLQQEIERQQQLNQPLQQTLRSSASALSALNVDALVNQLQAVGAVLEVSAENGQRETITTEQLGEYFSNLSRFMVS